MAVDRCRPGRQGPGRRLERVTGREQRTRVASRRSAPRARRAGGGRRPAGHRPGHRPPGPAAGVDLPRRARRAGRAARGPGRAVRGVCHDRGRARVDQGARSVPQRPAATPVRRRRVGPARLARQVPDPRPRHREGHRRPAATRTGRGRPRLRPRRHPARPQRPHRPAALGDTLHTIELRTARGGPDADPVARLVSSHPLDLLLLEPRAVVVRDGDQVVRYTLHQTSATLEP